MKTTADGVLFGLMWKVTITRPEATRSEYDAVTERPINFSFSLACAIHI